MRVGVPLAVEGDGLAGVAEAACAAESAGLDAVSCSEVKADPVLQLTLAAGATTKVDLMTGIAVAFARSPMLLAHQGWLLQEFSGGRLTLGLGSQIKPHIERRYAMPWGSPAARMAEYVAAMRAIWSAWRTGDKLDFRGDFYQHTLMTPMFTPEGSQPMPKVYIAAVGGRMTEVAGEVADGLLLHPFTTTTYVRTVTLPAVEAGRSRGAPGEAGRDFDVVGGSFIVTGRDEREYAESRRKVTEQIAFYGSTPAYRGVLEAHGWGDLGEELHRLSVSGDDRRWQTMGELISDEVLHEFAIVGAPEEIGPAMQARWGDLIAHYQVNGVGLPDQDLALSLARSIRGLA
ncbi:TIGR03617 family F420-dependent LLM class oxidoreductase [Nocardioides sp. Iso805N]|uniref:TIGR03617 family F420-dependent LLM class oxidoreductase n=1 Tax=Nocardioides sp. Iso805N TaxID=1283287 RepID=UPI0012FB2BDD|nr:TIGR03617 family F420-dependent LLM class oxidoreductase [Nocardioides sp. Iso805N]